ncbi:MAG TPA: polysaccharide deacetylase family protein [Candidatus Saccharimonadales bacterium]|nr:polysaccharide deacetylase family protein [Candidatus Saccharimonadales bacterium]
MTGRIGLRIDVDTFRGTRLGVPALCRILGRHDVRATFFFSVGPDNMGRHLLRLLRPAFFMKMLRTRASKLYGWDILFRGTLWPGPVIGVRLAEVIRDAAAAGHEIGLHAWDHHHWQAHVERMGAPEVADEVRRGLELLSRTAGVAPACTAAPAWKCTEPVLVAKAGIPQIRYNSDCRGEGIFRPVVEEGPAPQPQVPVNLPTWDEAVGRDGVTEGGFGDFLISRLVPGGYNVLAVHAEVEGIAAASHFDRLVARAKDLGYRFVPLGDLAAAAAEPLPQAPMIRSGVPGREGWISVRG